MINDFLLFESLENLLMFSNEDISDSSSKRRSIDSIRYQILSKMEQVNLDKLTKFIAKTNQEIAENEIESHEEL